MGTVLSDPNLRIVRYGGHISLVSGPRVAHARCEIIEHFLDDPECQRADWLWLLDDDMVFEGDALPRLLGAADPTERPVVGGLCFAGGVASATPFPTLYRFTDGDGGLETIFDYPDNEVCKVEATGAACLLVHRGVLETMRRVFGRTERGPNPYPWFAEGMLNKAGSAYGEDIAFCLRLKMLGVPLFVHTGVKLGHVKETVIDEATFLRARAAEARL
jgi:GT2 family glycosyltransferase